MEFHQKACCGVSENILRPLAELRAQGPAMTTERYGWRGNRGVRVALNRFEPGNASVMQGHVPMVTHLGLHALDSDQLGLEVHA